MKNFAIVIIGFMLHYPIWANASEHHFQSVSRSQSGPPGNFKYVYSYTCKTGEKGTFDICTGNDNEAKMLAELEVESICEMNPDKSKETPNKPPKKSAGCSGGEKK